MVAVACISLQLLASTSAFNIDTRQPIVKTLPAPDNAQTDALFGYSLVLHQIADVTGASRLDFLARSR